MEMAIDEPRQQGRPTEVDDLRVGAPPGGNVMAIANTNDRAADDRHPGRRRANRVERASSSVGEDEVCDGHGVMDHR
jgi:hypothetical protein